MKKILGLLVLIGIMISGSMMVSYADEQYNGPWFQEAAGQYAFVAENEEGYYISDSSDDNALLMIFDSEGRGAAYTGIFEGSYFKDGLRYMPAEAEYIDIDGIRYVIGTDGSTAKLTGILDGQYWYNGKKSTATGVRNGKLLKDGKVVTGLSGKIVTGGYIYSVKKSGKASLYLKEVMVSAKTISGEVYLYSVDSATGKAVRFTGMKDDQYYSKGKVSTVTGVRSSTLLKKGKKVTGISGKLVTGGYIYRVKKDGSAKLITGDQYGSYFVPARTIGGARYIYRAWYSTGKAEKNILRRDEPTYRVLIGKKAYEVLCDTAEYMSFTGCHLGRYYRNGKVCYSSNSFFCVTGEYVYKVSPKGYARRYVRNRNSSKTYELEVDGFRYVVYEDTGRIKEDSKKRSEIVLCARKYIGCNDDDGSHRKIIDRYNSQKKLPREYSVKYDDEWCATFVSAIAMECGYSDIIPLECSCNYQMMAWQKLGRWIENDAYVPLPGDIIYYDWDARGNGDCRGIPDHVGIVECVKDGKITVIEGNYKGKVKRRTIRINYSKIRGFAKPVY